MIVFGLYIMGVLKVPFLDLERRMNLKAKPAGYLGSFLIGITFAVAWVPCVGPILGAILVLASASETLASGVILLAFYSLGLAIPFLITSLLLNFVLGYLKRVEKYMGAIKIVSGLLLVLIGLLLLLNYFQTLVTFLV